MPTKPTKPSPITAQRARVAQLAKQARHLEAMYKRAESNAFKLDRAAHIVNLRLEDARLKLQAMIDKREAK